MSTTDTRAAFEAWAWNPNHGIFTCAMPKDRNEFDFYENDEVHNTFRIWQAATEAAKATGTAGELPPPDYIAGTKGMLCENAWSRETVEAYGQACAEAARQSLMQLFLDPENQPTQYGTVLAARQPVLSDERIDHISRSYFADEHDQTKAKGVIHDALRQAGVADAKTLREAERYRYLRSVVYPEKFYASGHPSWVIRYHLRGESFDSAVDHAIIAATNRSQP